MSNRTWLITGGEIPSKHMKDVLVGSAAVHGRPTWLVTQGYSKQIESFARWGNCQYRSVSKLSKAPDLLIALPGTKKSVFSRAEKMGIHVCSVEGVPTDEDG